MAKPRTNPTSLTEEQQELLIEDALNGRILMQSAAKLGFTNKVRLWSFLQKHPELNDRLKQARFESCIFLEDDLLNMHILEPDFKMARVRSDNLIKILAFRHPERYSQRIDMNVNMSVSMRANIDAANQRIEGMMREVVQIGSGKVG